MATTDFEQNDGLDDLSSEELEERAFGPDPSRKRTKRPRRSRKEKATKKEKAQAVVQAPAPPPAPAVVVTKFCYACGAEVDARAEVCPYCGVRQPEVPAAGRRAGRGKRKKSKGAATLLALTLGGVGAHRFYLGQPKVGLALLLFCWTFIPIAVGLVDFVRYVFMSDRRFAALYEGESSVLLVPQRPVRRLARASAVRGAALSAEPIAADEGGRRIGEGGSGSEDRG